VRHGDSAEAIQTYKVEPYVVAADVYTNPQHAGRGGWTWYTGSAGWMYRLVTESLLGLRLETDRLFIQPLIPAAWEGFVLHYRYHQTSYHLHVTRRAGGATRLRHDGVEQRETFIALVNDGKEHLIEIEMGPEA
jgi:cellobiose phosphorylase